MQETWQFIMHVIMQSNMKVIMKVIINIIGIFANMDNDSSIYEAVSKSELF